MNVLLNPWIQLLIMALILWALFVILGKFGIPAKAHQIIGWVFAGLIVIDAILLALGGGWVPYRVARAETKIGAQPTSNTLPLAEPSKIRAQTRA